MFGPCFVIQFFVSVLFCNHLDGEERAGCFAICLSSWCLVTVSVMWFFLVVPWVGLWCVFVLFPDHTHFLFYADCRIIPLL